MSSPVAKLSTGLAVTARSTAITGSPQEKVIRLYRHIQKQVPYLLQQYDIDESVASVRANIKREFIKHSAPNMDVRMVNMLVFKGQNELDEALAHWKTRTHILKYVYDVVYKPHLARSKLDDVPMTKDMEGLSESMKRFLANS